MTRQDIRNIIKEELTTIQSEQIISGKAKRIFDDVIEYYRGRSKTLSDSDNYMLTQELANFFKG